MIGHCLAHIYYQRFFSTAKYVMGKSKKVNQVVTEDITKPGPISLRKSGEVQISVHAKPGAKISGITSIDDDGVGIQIAARPVDGEANSELVNFVGKLLGLKKSEIALDKGSKSRQKTLIISSPGSTVENVLNKLKSAIDNN